MSMSIDDVLSGIILGTTVMGILWMGVVKYQTVNISDAEFYRFCMQKNITLPDCRISREILDKNQARETNNGK